MEKFRKASPNFRKFLRTELDYWQYEGIISTDQKDKIYGIYSLDNLGRETLNTLMWLIYIIASALIGVGIISFVAAHWGDISKPIKLAILSIAMLASHIIGFYLWQVNGRCKKLGHSLIILGTLIFGANIGLIAQIFHIQSRPYNAFGAWALGAIAIAYALKSVPNAIIAIITSFIFFAGDLKHIFWFYGVEPLTFYPFLAAAIFLPFSYKNKSIISFLLTILVISISTIVISMHTRMVPEFLTFTISAVGVALLLFGWGLINIISEKFKSFGFSGAVIGTIFILFIIYLLSFVDIAKNLFDTRIYRYSLSVEWNWLIPITACYIVGIPCYLIGIIKIKTKDFLSTYSRAQLLMILILLGSILTTLYRQNELFTVVFANVFMAFCGILFIIFSFKSHLRTLFWIGTSIMAIMVISRSLEYETRLIVKAIAFISIGIALLVSGIIFEKFLKKRRLADA